MVQDILKKVLNGLPDYKSKNHYVSFHPPTDVSEVAEVRQDLVKKALNSQTSSWIKLKGFIAFISFLSPRSPEFAFNIIHQNHRWRKGHRFNSSFRHRGH